MYNIYKINLLFYIGYIITSSSSDSSDSVGSDLDSETVVLPGSGDFSAA